MSLNYDLTEVKDRDTSDEGWSRTEAVIFACLVTGIGEITEESAPVFYARIHVHELLNGSLWRNPDGTDRYITPADVRAHIGLKTNVFPRESDASWRKRVVGGALNGFQTDYKREKDKLPVAG